VLPVGVPNPNPKRHANSQSTVPFQPSGLLSVLFSFLFFLPFYFYFFPFLLINFSEFFPPYPASLFSINFLYKNEKRSNICHGLVI
jgi:hypothetical protein